MVHWFLVVVQQLLGSWDCCLGQLLKDSAGCLKIYIHMGYYQYFKYILRLTTHPWITNPSNCLGRKFPRDAAVLFPWPIFTLSIERRGWCATETSPHSGQIPPTHTQPHLCKIHPELVLSRNSACSFILFTGISFLIKILKLVSTVRSSSAEMEKAADAADTSVLFFSAGANF